MAQSKQSEQVVNDLKTRMEGMAKNLVREVYGAEGMPWGTPFSELEDVSVALGQCLSRMMIEEAAGRQAEQTSEASPEYEVCPTCGQPVSEAKSRSRPLTTRAGEVQWDEPQRYCRQCRRAFFPSGEESAASG